MYDYVEYALEAVLLRFFVKNSDELRVGDFKSLPSVIANIGIAGVTYKALVLLYCQKLKAGLNFLCLTVKPRPVALLG